MNKLSPRKGPVYYRLENSTHLSDWNEENVPNVDFGGRKAEERRATRKSADFDDSGEGGHSNHKESCSDGILKIINKPSKPVRSLPNGTHSSNKLQPPRWKTKLLVLVCSLIIIVGVVLIIHFHETHLETITIGDNSLATAELILSEKTLKILDEKRNTRIAFSIAGDNLDSIGYKTARRCESEGGGVCLQWALYNTSLQIAQVELPDSQIKCFNISWRYTQPYAPVDCFYLDNEESDERRGQPVWYDSIHYILWSRIRTGPCVDSCHSYVPTHSKDQLDIGGTIVEPLWLSSQGSAIKASLYSPLEACLKVCKDVTRSKVCLRRKLDIFNMAGQSELSYMACFGSNVFQLQSEMMSKIVIPDSEKVTDVLFPKNSISDIKPSTRSLSQRCSPLFEKPLWNIDLNGDVYNATSVIEGELKDIADIGGTGFVYNISEVYAKIGDFSLHKFTSTNPEYFITAMHRMGFKTMLPLSPFINYDANNFFEASLKGFLLRNKFNEAPVLGEAPALGNAVFPAVIDFTNPDAFQWFVGNIKKFTKNSSVDFTQLLYGQFSWLPEKYHSKYSLSNPAFHSSLFSKVVDYLDSCPLTDVAFASQSRSQMVMLKPAGGIEGAMRVALASGLAGYPFFIPNLPFRLEEVGMLSSQMLEDGFIRWVQLVSFFPVAHMPWDFHILKNRAVDIARITNMVRKCMALRNGPIIGPALKLAIEKAEKTGHSPIISPIWMAPGLPAASDRDFMIERIYLIENQFMIGCDLMFAPILGMNLTHRTVYFPPGHWASLTDPKMRPIESDGRLWKKEFPVSLDNVLIFVRKS